MMVSNQVKLSITVHNNSELLRVVKHIQEKIEPGGKCLQNIGRDGRFYVFFQSLISSSEVFRSFKQLVAASS